jgi:hypothetical protein
MPVGQIMRENIVYANKQQHLSQTVILDFLEVQK